MRSLTNLAVALVLVGGCSSEPVDDVAAPPPSVTTSVTTSAEIPTTVATTIAPVAAEVEPPVESPTGAAPAAPAEVVLDGVGLGASGPYGVGVHRFETVDTARGDRPLPFSVWYPAQTTSMDRGEADAPPDRSGAPYPVVVGSMRGASMWAPHFASHGYVFVGSPGAPDGGWDTWILDYAADRLFALDWLETTDAEPLVGLADTAHTGVIDYSFGSIPTLALAGARISPDNYLTACDAPTDVRPSIRNNNCQAAEHWDTFESHAAALGVVTDKGRWHAMTDDRIKAAIPGAPEGGWLFGDDGLASATVPVLLMTGSEDDLNGYQFETAYMFDHLGSPTDLVTFVGADHFMILSADAQQQFERFATAFFGLHLKEDDRYAEFLDAEFVGLAPTLGIPPKVYESLTWGLSTD